jgi:hypothetical protein
LGIENEFLTHRIHVKERNNSYAKSEIKDNKILESSVLCLFTIYIAHK